MLEVAGSASRHDARFEDLADHLPDLNGYRPATEKEFAALNVPCASDEAGPRATLAFAHYSMRCEMCG
ncbi:hypothetical protein [Rhizobium yanglingense]